jgi:hypothetical protein
VINAQKKSTRGARLALPSLVSTWFEVVLTASTLNVDSDELGLSGLVVIVDSDVLSGADVAARVGESDGIVAMEDAELQCAHGIGELSFRWDAKERRPEQLLHCLPSIGQDSKRTNCLRSAA